MRITSVAQVRNDLLQEITDRSGFPLTGSTTNWALSFSGSVGIHTATTRATKTAGAGEYLLILGCSIKLIRATAPTTAGRVSGDVTVSHGSGAGDSKIGRAGFQDGGIGATESVHPANQVLVLPGESVKIITTDGGSGGTINYEIHVYGIAFSP